VVTLRVRLLTGQLTVPNGSSFCKYFKTRKVYGLTGKIPPKNLNHH